ncbi:MAG: AAA family ATPase [Oligoflexus sp.]|nr:AAA family ATPase [Oligoflexus sp.]
MTHEVLSPDELALIAEEEALCKGVIESIRQVHKSRRPESESAGDRLELLREEASTAKSADLPALFDQMNTQRAILGLRKNEPLPDPRSPYFAHLCLEEKGKQRDVLLGHLSFLQFRKNPIIDWKHAPVSRIFFNYREGEEYEEEFPGRIAHGFVIKRRVLTIYNSELLRIHAAGQSYRKQADGIWIRDKHGFSPSLSGGAGSANRTLQSGLGLTNTPAPEVSALLDPDQFRLLTADYDDPLLVLGGAGCGKTTIALHRIAFLRFKDPDHFPSNKILVVVPEEGLVRLSRKLLGTLGLSDVEVKTFDDWVEFQARRMLRNLPQRVCNYVPANVSRVKRHPAILSVFPEIVRRQMEEILRSATKFLPGTPSLATILRDRTDLCMADRFDVAEKSLLDEIEAEAAATAPMRTAAVKKFFMERRKRYLNTTGDRADLFSNMEILEKISEESGGVITSAMIRDLISHALDQLGQRPEDAYSGYESDALETVDGKSLIDDEAEQTISGTIDPEDFAILLELQAYKSGKHDLSANRIKKYAHMVIDEAQDLAPVELKALSRALEDDAAITIAGDAAQQIDPTHSFESWERVLDTLNQPRVYANYLTTTYRSPRTIAAFAHAVLGPIAPAQPPAAVREGLPVARTIFPNEGQMAVFLTETLTQLMLDEPLASVAVLTKTPEYAITLYKLLRDIPKVRLVERGEFEFKAGIDITPASEVKGLEFDYVIVPDASRGVYLDKPEDRRLLHVAATRAIHQLWVISVGYEAAILPPEE